MQEPKSSLELLQLMGKRERKIKTDICRHITAPIVANARLGYLDLATTGLVLMRKLKHCSNMNFLNGYRISSLTPARKHKSLVESFMDDRRMLDWLIRRRFTRIIHTSLRNVFNDYVDRVDFRTSRLFRIGFCFKLDEAAKKYHNAFKYRTLNEKILRKLLTEHSQCHKCAVDYIRLLYPTKPFLSSFLCEIRETEVLEYFLQMTYKAGVYLWGPSELGQLTRDPLLYFMSVQRYELVHTLIDYGYTIYGFLGKVDKTPLILGFFGSYPVKIAPYRRLNALFFQEPEKTAMILYALGHCNSPKADGFLSAYERLHKSFGLPYYPTSYIRSFLMSILDVSQYHSMIEELCYAYERSHFGKYKEYSPRSLRDLATCAYRDVLKRLPCQLPTAISQLEFPVALKDLVALKT